MSSPTFVSVVAELRRLVDVNRQIEISMSGIRSVSSVSKADRVYAELIGSAGKANADALAEVLANVTSLALATSGEDMLSIINASVGK